MCGCVMVYLVRFVGVDLGEIELLICVLRYDLPLCVMGFVLLSRQYDTVGVLRPLWVVCCLLGSVLRVWAL